MKTLFKHNINRYFFISLALLGLYSCQNNNENEPANVTVYFEHKFNTSSFALNTNYVNGSGDTVNFSKLKYYISNVELISAGGENWKETESYHLIDVSQSSSLSFSLNNVPGGEYTGIKFLVGVDSVRNVSGAQTGALDPANEMFWSWSTGYIFFKAEGTSPQSSNGTFTYHIGGFAGPNHALRWVTINFGSENLLVGANHEREVHLKVDVKKLFDGSNYTLSVANVHHQMMVNAVSASIANNYAEMYSLDHIHN